MDPELDTSKEKALKSMLKCLDSLILCGDNAELFQGLHFHNRLFAFLRKTAGIPMAFVLGNHDLFGHIMRRGVSYNELASKLDQFSDLAKSYDLIHLEREDLMIGSFTIIGTYGHYDGSLSGDKFKEDSKTVARLVCDLESRL